MSGYLTSVPTPAGLVHLAADDQGLVYCSTPGAPEQAMLNWLSEKLPAVVWQIGENEHLRLAALQLADYCRGERQTFSVQLHPIGTDWQLQVWQQLLDIPYGETRTYGQIAAAAGKPQAARAVGQANNRNPLAIIIPCHRVIGSDRALIGYGGGLPTKRWLLDLEGITYRD